MICILNCCGFLIVFVVMVVVFVILCVGFVQLVVLVLQVMMCMFDIDGCVVMVFGLINGNGMFGLILDFVQCFLLDLNNDLIELMIIYWYGQILLNVQDGVFDMLMLLLQSGEMCVYDFEVVVGVYWMYSYVFIQEMQLLVVFLIVCCFEDL